MKLSRRGFAVGAGALLVGGAVLAVPPVRRSLCGSPEQRYRDTAMAALGRACVGCDPALSRDAVAAEWRVLDRPEGERRATLARADFASGRMRQLDGWLLAPSEVLAFAAAYHGLAA
ncbi:hypothetical protein LK533_07255 [Sphingomonas sp. PL-96]|uniref:hypothetical protein n=1 Tax=Sphingomonas sp. PL-96 TaxID=2887201 RepID=UPI001E643296|nr:hypothetical protein [Sphingomonas sp. PL-96]MCC2976470.1 hypothetical protein [Sphingomonas sp. PL-96]